MNIITRDNFPQGPEARIRLMGDIWAAREFERHLLTLCDRIGVRFGSRGEKTAAGYILDQFRSYNLDKAHKEKFTCFTWKHGPAFLELKPDKQRLQITAIGFTPSTPRGGINAALAVVNSFRTLATLKNQRALAGKIALVIPEEGGRDISEHSSIIVRRAARAGARAVIIATPVLKSDSAANPPIPAAGIAREDALRLARLARDSGRLEVRMFLKNNPKKQAVTCNVIGEIRGVKRPNEIILVAAHYDTKDNTVGAADDASGTAAVMELARVFSKYYRGKLARTIRFVCFTGEELGLAGSNAYVKKHAREMRNIVMMFNLDPANSTNYWVGGFAETLRWLKETAKTAGWQNRAQHYVAYNTDCFPFLLKGVPAVWMMSRERRGWLFDPAQLTYGHTRRDTPDKVDIFDAKEAIMVVADTCLRLDAARHRPDHHHSAREVRQWLSRDPILEERLKTGGLWPAAQTPAVLL